MTERKTVEPPSFTVQSDDELVAYYILGWTLTFQRGNGWGWVQQEHEEHTPDVMYAGAKAPDFKKNLQAFMWLIDAVESYPKISAEICLWEEDWSVEFGVTVDTKPRLVTNLKRHKSPDMQEAIVLAAYELARYLHNRNQRIDQI